MPWITYGDATDSVLNVVYSICIALWTTFFVESWKRKENWLANRWLVRDFKEVSFDRKEYKYKLGIDSELRSVWKMVEDNFWLYYLFISPVSILFMLIVIGTYVGIQEWQFIFSDIPPINNSTLGNSTIFLG